MKKRDFRFYWEKPYPKKESDIKIDIPGFGRDEISVKIEGGMISITAEKKSRRKKTGKGYYMEEASFSSFSKSVPLPEDAKSLKAEVKDGAVVLKRKKKKAA